MGLKKNLNFLRFSFRFRKTWRFLKYIWELVLRFWKVKYIWELVLRFWKVKYISCFEFHILKNISGNWSVFSHKFSTFAFYKLLEPKGESRLGISFLRTFGAKGGIAITDQLFTNFWSQRGNRDENLNLKNISGEFEFRNLKILKIWISEFEFRNLKILKIWIS